MFIILHNLADTMFGNNSSDTFLFYLCVYGDLRCVSHMSNKKVFVFLFDPCFIKEHVETINS